MAIKINLKGYFFKAYLNEKSDLTAIKMVHWCFIHVCFVQVTMCGAPDTLTRLGARTFLLISRLLGLLKDYSGAPNDVQNCHLDKTNMDNSPMHRS